MNGAGEKSFAANHKWPRVLVFGIGDGGLRWVESMLGSAPAGAELAVLAHDGEALRRSRVPRKSRLGARVERKLVSGLFEGFEAVILVADLAEPEMNEIVVETARLALGLRRITLAVVSLPRVGDAGRRRANAVSDGLAAGVHAHFSTTPGWARDSEAELRSAVLSGAQDLVGLLRRSSAEELLQGWEARRTFGPGKGLGWMSGTRGGPTRGPSRGLGMEEEKEEKDDEGDNDNESTFLGGKIEDEPRVEPPFDLSAEEERSSGPATPTVDQVDFTVTAPKTVTPGEGFLLELWAHTREQLDEVLERAGTEVGHKTQGAVELARGTELVVEVKIADFTIDEPRAALRWLGSIGNVSFAVTVPAARKPGSVLGQAKIHAAGIHVMTLNFQLQVGKQEPAVAPLPAWEVRYRSAFASYSSKDRDEVLGRIQGMQKVAPELDVFLDVASLHSGDDWQQRLWQEIGRRDRFFLFWSKHAKDSPWVERGWRLALETRGLDFIDPVPLVPPEQAPPPPELGAKHFNDKWLAFRRAPAPA